jgi:polysaccharide chain length determinant protein (PEP-CTERM system associated)
MGRWYPLVAQSLATAWRWRWALVATAWAVCIVGWIAVVVAPNSYESQTRIYVDADAVLTPLLRGIAIETASHGQLEAMRKTLLSRPNLEKLISVTNLELQAGDVQDRELMVRRLAKFVKVEAQDRNIFTISYRDSNPRLAHDVVTALLSIFMEESTRTSRSDMNNAQRFLGRQIDSYEAQLRTAERRRAEFRRKYLDILPLEQNGGSRLDTARTEVQNLEARLKDATLRLASLQAQLAVTSATIATETITGSGDAELAAAERHLAELRAKFTERHPDVIIARRVIESLSPGAARRPARTVGGRAIPNPVHQQLRLQAIETEGDVASLKARIETARKDRERLEELARAAPGVDAEYQNLDRDYNVIRKNYEELLARREASNITSAADTTADKIQLRVIDPPQIPAVPVAPNRLLLISVVLVAGVGAAGSLVILLSQLDRSINDVGQLRAFGFPVLGGISAAPALGRSTAYAQATALTTAVLVLIAVYGALAREVISHPDLVPWIRTAGAFI